MRRVGRVDADALHEPVREVRRQGELVPAAGSLTLPTATPRVNPALLHGPHQPTYAVPPEIATEVAVWPAPRSKTFVQPLPLAIA